MLEALMRHVNNRFDRDAKGRDYGHAEGEFGIVGGSLEVEGLEDGQWFWVEGSALNDGLHLYPADDLEDEEFEGRVVFLRVPRNVVELAEDIESWVYDNAKVLDGPYQSESFGGYSYTKASTGSGSDGTYVDGWQAHFASRMRPFRKIGRDWV